VIEYLYIKKALQDTMEEAMRAIKLLYQFTVLCALSLGVVSTASVSYAEDCSGLLLPGMEGTINCGAVGTPVQEGTTINIAPNVLNLFPEIQAAGWPQSVNLATHEVSLIGGTWDDVFAEWARREQAQNQPVQQALPAFQTTGFTSDTSWLFGQTPTLGTGTNFDMFSGSSLFGTAFPTSTGYGSSGWSFPSLSSSGAQSSNGIYPWMSSYWTATPTGTETQTGSEPLYPWLDSSAQPIGGAGISY
jgi:hypothetical protein